MKIKLAICLLALSACTTPVEQGNSITITNMLWQDTAAKIRANPNADIVYVSSGGGYMDHVIKIIKLIGDRKVICINQCVSAAAFVVVCGDHEWENRGQLLLHMPEDANGEQDQPVNDWLEENCDLPDLSRTSLKLFWFVEGNDLNEGYFDANTT